MSADLQKEFITAYDTYKDMVLRIAFTYVKNTEDAKDIMQDVFLKLYTANKTFDSEEHQKRWLIRIAVNKSKDYVKSFWNLKRQEMTEWQSGSLIQEEKQDIWEEVHNLPVKYRAVIYLHYYEGYRLEEIAEILGIRLSAVKMRAKRGREMLRLELESEKGENYETTGFETNV